MPEGTMDSAGCYQNTASQAREQPRHWFRTVKSMPTAHRRVLLSFRPTPMPKLHLPKRPPAPPLDAEDSTYLLSTICNALYTTGAFALWFSHGGRRTPIEVAGAAIR
jgi:hypothetical protein